MRIRVRSLASLRWLRIWWCELWCRPATMAPVWPLAWEPLYAVGAALKKKKKKKKKKKRKKKKKKKKKKEKKKRPWNLNRLHHVQFSVIQKPELGIQDLWYSGFSRLQVHFQSLPTNSLLWSIPYSFRHILPGILSSPYSFFKMQLRCMCTRHCVLILFYFCFLGSTCVIWRFPG